MQTASREETIRGPNEPLWSATLTYTDGEGRGGGQALRGRSGLAVCLSVWWLYYTYTYQ